MRDKTHPCLVLSGVLFLPQFYKSITLIEEENLLKLL